MYFEIHHETRYAYSAPVHLGRHTLRLRPISDANQHLHRFEITVTPAPAGPSALSDLDGNYATAVWWDEPTTELLIETESIVETLRSNPFDYLWQGADALPLKYSAAFSEALGAFRASIVPQPVRDLGEEVTRAVNGNAQAFPLELAATLHERFPRVIREHGDPWEAPETLQRGEGSCRDLAVLFMAVARSQGYRGAIRQRLQHGVRRRRRARPACLGGAIHSGRWLARLRPDHRPGRRRPPHRYRRGSLG